MKIKKSLNFKVWCGSLIALASLFILSSCTRKDTVPYIPAPFIADPVFLAYCLGATDIEGNPRIDLDDDGVLTKAEAAQVEEIYLDNEGGGSATGVRSLAGIEHFTNLRRLGIGNNSIVTLDLSGNPLLTYLNCSDNPLTSIALTANSLLETLNCHNNNLAALDVSMLPALKYLYCTNNRLTELSLDGNTLLRELSCDRNRLSALDVGKCSALTDLSCAGNGLSSLSLPESGALARLDCGTHERDGVSLVNKLEELDLSDQDKLSLLRANTNPLSALDVSECASLRTLECVGCELPELDITANTLLRALSCNGNPAGMKIYVPAGFDHSKFLFWKIGTATLEEKE